jgi:toxin ParE1/3/4
MTEIVWTTPAVADLGALHDYIARDSEYYADGVLSDIFDAVDRLASFPRSGRRVPEIDDNSLREVLVGNYRIMYNISGSGTSFDGSSHVSPVPRSALKLTHANHQIHPTRFRRRF